MEIEQTIKELEEIKSKLESSDISFDESIKLFEKSVKDSKECLEKLKSYEGKITLIKKDLDSFSETVFNADIEE